MEKEFIGYAEALSLKELGFDEPCLGKFYFIQLEIGGNWCNNDFKEDPDVFISAPLYQQAFRWFREKYNLQSIIIPFAENSIDENSNTLYYYIINKKQFYGFVNAQEEIGFNSQEEAELECLKKLIEIVKQQKEDGSKITL
jgi:hypothetical protein